MNDIDRLSRSTPFLCKLTPATQQYHIEDGIAGGIVAILNELAKADKLDLSVSRQGSNLAR